jgi:hypothetical protein
VRPSWPWRVPPTSPTPSVTAGAMRTGRWPPSAALRWTGARPGGREACETRGVRPASALGAGLHVMALTAQGTMVPKDSGPRVPARRPHPSPPARVPKPPSVNEVRACGPQLTTRRLSVLASLLAFSAQCMHASAYPPNAMSSAGTVTPSQGLHAYSFKPPMRVTACGSTACLLLTGAFLLTDCWPPSNGLSASLPCSQTPSGPMPHGPRRASGHAARVAWSTHAHGIWS